jgi:CheY-like chemotaxis protein
MSDTARAPEQLKVLVIEDDTLTRAALCRLLQKMNCITIEACNGFMGLAEFRRVRPNVVFTDIFMPDKEGLATILEIRAIDPGAKIIAMSGGTPGSDVLQIAEEVGAAQTLRKPFMPADVLQVIETLKSAAV